MQPKENSSIFTNYNLTILFSTAFLIILSVLHLLKPEFDPSWRMISEYEIGAYGWMMRLAFFCWGISTFSLVFAIWPACTTGSGKVGRTWLALIGIALFGAGIFATNAITDTTVSTVDILHKICGTLVILTFPIASLLIVRGLIKHKQWDPYRHQIIFIEIIVWLGMCAFFGSIIASRAVHPGIGRVGPEIWSGWPNRLMVVCYHAWLITTAVDARRAASIST